MKNKLVGILLILIMVIVIMPSCVFADYDGINTDINLGDTSADTSSEEITNNIVGALQAAGTWISVIALIIIGMKYMFSSIEEKSQMKGVIGYYIAGCVLVFATSNVLAFAYDVIDSARHSWKTTRVEPTCTVAGKVLLECEDWNCDAYEETILPALGHSFGGWSQKSAATCTSATIIKRTCSRCGYEQTNTSGSALGHNFGSWTQKTAATCTAAQIQKRTCSRCNKTEERNNVSALGHSWGAWTIKTNPTCIAGQIRQHTCSRCNKREEKEYGSPLGHSYGGWVTVYAATCTSSGDRQKTCSRCYNVVHELIPSYGGHNYGQWTTTTSPGCSTSGYKTHSCTRCSHTQEQTIHPLGHNLEYTGTSEWDGPFNKIYKFKCSRCTYTLWNEHEDGGGKWLD